MIPASAGVFNAVARKRLRSECMVTSHTSMTFLIVDDNPMVSQSLRNYICENGYRCTALQDSTKALEWLDHNPCDAVLSDIRMPEIDGITLTKMIRAKHPTLPILISTSLGYDEDMIQAAVKAGANGYISKVMGPKLLLLTLLQTAERRAPVGLAVAA